jgi:hypothetical protein
LPSQCCWAKARDLVLALGQLDATRLAAPTGVDLRLDDPLFAADLVGRLDCLLPAVSTA